MKEKLLELINKYNSKKWWYKKKKIEKEIINLCKPFIEERYFDALKHHFRIGGYGRWAFYNPNYVYLFSGIIYACSEFIKFETYSHCTFIMQLWWIDDKEKFLEMCKKDALNRIQGQLNQLKKERDTIDKQIDELISEELMVEKENV